jgi:hypothetical protein
MGHHATLGFKYRDLVLQVAAGRKAEDLPLQKKLLLRNPKA